MLFGLWFSIIAQEEQLIPMTQWLQDPYTEGHKTETAKGHINQTGELCCVYGPVDFALLSDQFFPSWSIDLTILTKIPI